MCICLISFTETCTASVRFLIRIWPLLWSERDRFNWKCPLPLYTVYNIPNVELYWTWTGVSELTRLFYLTCYIASYKALWIWMPVYMIAIQIRTLFCYYRALWVYPLENLPFEYMSFLRPCHYSPDKDNIYCLRCYDNC